MLTYYKNISRTGGHFDFCPGRNLQHLKGWCDSALKGKSFNVAFVSFKCPQKTKASTLPLLKGGLLKRQRKSKVITSDSVCSSGENLSV